MLAKLTSKGQLTLPKALRERLHLREGDRVEFVVHDDGRVELIPVTSPISKLRGMVKKPARARTLEEIEAAIKRSAADL